MDFIATMLVVAVQITTVSKTEETTVKQSRYPDHRVSFTPFTVNFSLGKFCALPAERYFHDKMDTINKR